MDRLTAHHVQGQERRICRLESNLKPWIVRNVRGFGLLYQCEFFFSGELLNFVFPFQCFFFRRKLLRINARYGQSRSRIFGPLPRVVLH